MKTHEAGRFVCPRCKTELCDRMAAMPPRETSPDPAKSAGPLPPSQAANFAETPEVASLDTWDLDEQLRHVARLLGLDPADPAQARARLDPAQPAAQGWHRQPGRRGTKKKQPRLRRKLRVGEALSAAATWLGVATLTCGLCLLGWSELASRAELQAVGLVIAVGGILMLAIGMTLRLGQSDSLAHSPLAQRRVDPHSPVSRHHTHLGRPTSRRSNQAA